MPSQALTRRLIVVSSAALFVFATTGGHLGATAFIPEQGGHQCGNEMAPCALVSGEHDGTLQPFVNPKDHYMFTPPPGAVAIDVQADSDAQIKVALRDPDGHIRSVGNNVDSTLIEIHGIAQPEGEWRLEIGYLAGGGNLVGHEYSFTIGWVVFEHMQKFHVPAGTAPTVAVDFPTSDPARFDLVYDVEGHDNPVHRSVAAVFAYQFTSNDETWLNLAGSVFCCGVTDDLVKTWGETPSNLHVQTPELGVVDGSSAAFAYRHDASPATVEIGYSVSTGIRGADAWLLWDTEPPILENHDGDAFFHRAKDLEGGTGLFAAGYTLAQDLHIHEEVPSASTHTTLLFANAFNPELAVLPTQASISREGGPGMPLIDDFQFFSSYHSEFGSVDGDWTYRLVHVDGLERDTLRFVGVSFPIQPWWES